MTEEDLSFWPSFLTSNRPQLCQNMSGRQPAARYRVNNLSRTNFQDPMEGDDLGVVSSSPPDSIIFGENLNVVSSPPRTSVNFQIEEDRELAKRLWDEDVKSVKSKAEFLDDDKDSACGSVNLDNSVDYDLAEARKILNSLDERR